MMEFLEIIGMCVIALIGAGVLLFFVSIWMGQSTDDKTRRQQQEHYNRGHAEDMEENRLLEKVLMYPQGSNERADYEEEWKVVHARNEKLSNARIKKIVSRYPTEQELDELARGVNPYKKAKR
jgi:hypothetical protein